MKRFIAGATLAGAVLAGCGSDGSEPSREFLNRTGDNTEQEVFTRGAQASEVSGRLAIRTTTDMGGGLQQLETRIGRVSSSAELYLVCREVGDVPSEDDLEELNMDVKDPRASLWYLAIVDADDVNGLKDDYEGEWVSGYVSAPFVKAQKVGAEDVGGDGIVDCGELDAVLIDAAAQNQIYVKD